MTISAELVGKLRQMTDAPMMDCKRALEKSGGDLEIAKEELRKLGIGKAAKKADRTAAEGSIFALASPDHKKAIMLELNCETDFVARAEGFSTFGNVVAQQGLAAGVTTMHELSQLAYQQSDKQTIEQMRQEVVAKLGENIQLRRMAMLNTSDGVIGIYVHSNKIGVLVQLAKSHDLQLAKDIAMHIAASNPHVVSSEDVAPELIAKEKEIFIAQAQQSGKPADIIAKMVEGRISKFLEEVSLLGQPFVKDPTMTIAQLLKNADANVTRFVRFVVGEGIEKETVDFAQEVMAQVKQ